MPLRNGYSKIVVSDNIATERRNGKSEKQAVAIALNSARESWRKRNGKKAYPEHLKTRKSNPRTSRKKDHLWVVFQVRGEKVYYASISKTGRVIWEGARVHAIVCQNKAFANHVLMSAYSPRYQHGIASLSDSSATIMKAVKGRATSKGKA